jgi:hypothetical protein
LLIDRAKQLEKYALEWWIPYLLPVLEKFLEAYDGVADERFWNSSYKIYYTSGSGAIKTVNGWIINFFPYVQEGRSKNLLELKKIYKI